jgi:transposase
MPVDAPGHLLALHVTPAERQDRSRVKQLAREVQKATGKSVELAFVDHGSTGEKPAEDAAKQGIKLEVVKLSQAKRGFVLLPRRWVVERSFAWLARFRRTLPLAADVGVEGRPVATAQFVQCPAGPRAVLAVGGCEDQAPSRREESASLGRAAQ